MAVSNTDSYSYDPTEEYTARRAGSYRFSKIVMRFLAFVLMRKDWAGYENLPASGPAILAINHLNESDPINVALFTDRAGRHPRFMAKAELFKIRGLRHLLIHTGQIPVYRETREAGSALSAAVRRLKADGCVLVYPEGTITKDPNKWPMVARTGIARLVIETGAPVIPIAQWGPQLLPKKWRPWRRIKVAMRALPALDLKRFDGAAMTTATLNEITDIVMTSLREGVAELRGEPVPNVVWDNRKKTHVSIKDSDSERKSA